MLEVEAKALWTISPLKVCTLSDFARAPFPSCSPPLPPGTLFVCTIWTNRPPLCPPWLTRLFPFSLLQRGGGSRRSVSVFFLLRQVSSDPASEICLILLYVREENLYYFFFISGSKFLRLVTTSVKCSYYEDALRNSGLASSCEFFFFSPIRNE